VERVAIVAVTADRGLAGGFNAQVIRRSLALMREVQSNGQEAVWFSTGRKAASTLRFRRMNVSQSWVGFSERPGYGDAQAIAHAVSDAYVKGEVDRVVVVYNAFVSALVQKVTVRELLPISQELLEQAAEDAGEDAIGGTPDFIYEPEPEEILARLLPVYVETELYRALLESAASEQGARMTAMRNASKAAGELIDSLTLAMNRARQAEITQEILEVVAGADALNG
jgi:F-type H+-transporting ATPase subunit gamma